MAYSEGFLSGVQRRSFSRACIVHGVHKLFSSSSISASISACISPPSRLGRARAAGAATKLASAGGGVSSGGILLSCGIRSGGRIRSRRAPDLSRDGIRSRPCVRAARSRRASDLSRDGIRSRPCARAARSSSGSSLIS
eukprot:scaffold11167_cov63-Phaeocystis_antarctica.AAC.3